MVSGKLHDTVKDLTKKFTGLIFNHILTFQSILEKNACLLISSTPSGPAPFIRKKNVYELFSSWSKEWLAKLYFLFLNFRCMTSRNNNTLVIT